MIIAQEIISSIVHPNYEIKVNSGMSIGKIFELDDNGCDYFGDPVNIVSKLAEDIPNKLFAANTTSTTTLATVGEMLISLNSSTDINQEDEMNIISSFRRGPIFQSQQVTISGVDIAFYSMKSLGKKFLKLNSGGSGGYSCNCKGGKNNTNHVINDDIDNNNNDDGSMVTKRRITTNNDIDWEEAVMLQSDLSGFTKLTKKYGILHFLTLIIHCRKIFGQHLSLCKDQGRLVKFEGDNIICKFDNAAIALEFILKVYQSVQEYNNDKDDDYQIRVKFGLAKGQVLVSNDGDVVGEAWEECCLLAEDKAEVGEVLVTEKIVNELISLEDELSTKYQFDLRQEDGDIGLYFNVVM